MSPAASPQITGTDGATAADWQITGPMTANLRSDRAEQGQERSHLHAATAVHGSREQLDGDKVGRGQRASRSREEVTAVEAGPFARRDQAVEAHERWLWPALIFLRSCVVTHGREAPQRSRLRIRRLPRGLLEVRFLLSCVCRFEKQLDMRLAANGACLRPREISSL